MTWLIAAVITALTISLSLGERRDLSPKRWWLLMGLRISAVLLLVLWLGGLRLRSPGGQGNVQELVVLVDGSSSMLLPQGPGPANRWDAACRLIDKTAQWFSKFKAITVVLSGDSLVPYRSGELKNPSGHTNLGQGILLAKKFNPAAIVLLSDGNHNLGDDPVVVAAGGIPVHTIGLGPLDGGDQPRIADVLSPTEAEIGGKVSVRLWLKGNTQGSSVYLQEDSRILSSHPIKGTADSLVEMALIPQESGLHKYDLVLKNRLGLLDSRSLSLTVVKNRFKIAYLAAQPGWNLRFIIQALQFRPAYDTDIFILKDKRWISQTGGNELKVDSLKGYDLFIISDCDDIGQELQQRIYQSVCSSRKGILFLSECSGSGPLSDLQPLNGDERGPAVTGSATAAYGLTATGILSEQQSRNLNRLPPLFLGKNLLPVSPEVTVLSFVLLTGGRTVPWWALRYCGTGRSAQIAVNDLWKWRLAAAGAGRDTTVYNSLVLGTLDWLRGTVGGSLTAGPERNLYWQGQEIAFKGRWEVYREQEDNRATWIVYIEGPAGMKRSFKLANWGNGDFRASAGSLPPGEYSFKTSLDKSGSLLFRNTGKFWVMAESGEERDVLQNVGLLKEISRVSGGNYWDYSTGGQRPTWSIASLSHESQDGEDFRLTLLLVSMLLSLEWFLRRKWGQD